MATFEQTGSDKASAQKSEAHSDPQSGFQKELAETSQHPWRPVTSIPDSTRQLVENSLHLHSSTPDLLITGALAGAGTNVVKFSMQSVANEVVGVVNDSDLIRGLPLNGLGSSALEGAAKGIGIAGAAVAAGYVADTLGSNIFGYKQPEVHGLAQTLVDGVAIPAVLLSDMPTGVKLGLAASAFVGNRVAGMLGGTDSSTSISSLFRPNTIDSVGMTVAALSTLDPRSKAIAIGGAYLAGRAYNELSQLAGWDKQPYELRDNSNNSIASDLTQRSKSSFAAAVDSGKILGKENEVALELQMRDWMDKQADVKPISYDRGAAAIADALGQFRLEEGSRFDFSSHQDTKPRVLKGFNYDFGGEATTWLRYSAGSLVKAQGEVEAHKGETIDGKIMDDSYKTQLKDLQTKVEGQLSEIYGPHDIDGIFKALKDPKIEPDLQRALVRMKNTLDVTNSEDKQFVAKQNRDISLGYLVEASRFSEHENQIEAAIMYKAALQYLQKSEQLVGKEQADNQALEKLQIQVAKQIPEIADPALKTYSEKMKN